MPEYRHIYARKNIGITGLGMQGFEAEIIRGIQDHAHTHNWQLFNANTPIGLQEMEDNRNFFSGVIAVVADDARAQALREFPCPVVNVSDTFPEKYGFPTVITDDRRIGIRAADFFIARGYRNFAVYPLPGEYEYRYVNTRPQAFIDRLRKRGFDYCGLADMYNDEKKEILSKAGFKLITTHEIPKPFAVFCPDDQIASRLCFVEKQRGIKVPEHMAVLGVDNFELHCNMTHPPLSSVDSNGFQIGIKASETLQKLIERKTRRKTGFSLKTVPPGDIVARDSVDINALYDPLLASARRFILEHCSERINVQDVVKATGSSRRKTEMAFRNQFGSTILHEIHQAKIARAKKLIEDTELPIYKIANLAGFRDPHQMCRVFAKHKETPPFEIKQSR